MTGISMITSLLALSISCFALRYATKRDRLHLCLRAEALAEEIGLLLDDLAASAEAAVPPPGVRLPEAVAALDRDHRRLSANTHCLSGPDLFQRVLDLQKLQVKVRHLLAKLRPQPAAAAMPTAPSPEVERLH